MGRIEIDSEVRHAPKTNTKNPGIPRNIHQAKEPRAQNKDLTTFWRENGSESY
jgi:hypothetical protein